MKNLEGIEISKSFKKRQIVEHISLHVQAGEIVGLLGPNGAGKTTIFLMILGIHKPDAGSIFLNGKNITYEPIYQRARLGISFLPQEPSIFNGLSVIENLWAITHQNSTQQYSSIEEILKEMGLAEIKTRRACLLSGGERRRLEIARSMLLNPDFLLLDEPFAGIDPIQIKEIQQLITKLKEKGLGIIITDHNVRDLLKITDRSYIINQGQVIFHGNSSELKNNQKVQDEYLGKEFKWN